LKANEIINAIISKRRCKTRLKHVEGKEEIALDDEENEAVSWETCGVNIIKAFEEKTKASKRKCAKKRELLGIFVDNLKVIDMLRNGDIVSMEGQRFISPVYHHTAIVTGKKRNPRRLSLIFVPYNMPNV
jgi:hypothetical protein